MDPTLLAYPCSWIEDRTTLPHTESAYVKEDTTDAIAKPGSTMTMQPYRAFVSVLAQPVVWVGWFEESLQYVLTATPKPFKSTFNLILPSSFSLYVLVHGHRP